MENMSFRTVLAIVCLWSLPVSAQDQSLLEEASNQVIEYEASLDKFGIDYHDAIKKLDQGHIEQAEALLVDLTASLEKARKEAMERDQLDEALRIRGLIDKYAQWLVADSEPEATNNNKPQKRHSAELAFERGLLLSKRKMESDVKKLNATMLKDASDLRDETIKKLEKLRVEAMRMDDLEQAKSIRDHVEAIKKTDLKTVIFSSEKKTEDQKQGANVPSIGELVVIIPPIGNTTTQRTFVVPKDVKKVEASFFSASTPNDAKSKHPGYKGILRINQKLIIAFIRKYRWRDGTDQILALAIDGSEVNSRIPASTAGAIDITDIAKPGETVSVSYGNGQLTGIGVRFYLHR